MAYFDDPDNYAWWQNELELLIDEREQRLSGKAEPEPDVPKNEFAAERFEPEYETEIDEAQYEKPEYGISSRKKEEAEIDGELESGEGVEIDEQEIADEAQFEKPEYGISSRQKDGTEIGGEIEREIELEINEPKTAANRLSKPERVSAPPSASRGNINRRSPEKQEAFRRPEAASADYPERECISFAELEADALKPPSAALKNQPALLEGMGAIKGRELISFEQLEMEAAGMRRAAKAPAAETQKQKTASMNMGR